MSSENRQGCLGDLSELDYPYIQGKRGIESAAAPFQSRPLLTLYMDLSALSVTEIQGLYGAYTFPEKLLQKIWLRGDFNRRAAVTADGRGLTIIHPGKWNFLGGPDFKGARLRFEGGAELYGDVEVHLRVGDWDAHRHAADSAYDGVILHVILFPPGPGQVTRGAHGKELPILALLPLLHHDLEEFAADEAVEKLANRAAARIPEELGRFPPEELDALLQTYAAQRWAQKVYFARVRVQRLGWESACHHAALDVLGYRYNRAPMLRIAGRWPLAEWSGTAIDAQVLYGSEGEHWSLQGVRPANHPRRRLHQYARWVRERPEWPAGLKALGLNLSSAVALPPKVTTTREQRRELGLGALRLEVAQTICGGALVGTRLDNLVCDGFLPLLATLADSQDHTQRWHHWFAGDLPPVLVTGLRRLGVFDGHLRPACHGVAQGLLGWLLAREVRA